MAEPSDHPRPWARCAVLERRIAELEASERQVVALERQVSALQARVAELERLLTEALRASKRQAAPFSRNKPNEKPKKPGRPEGHAAALRPAPPMITETINVPLTGCPDCGAERALRPAVIARKLCAGNRSPTGASTHGIPASPKPPGRTAATSSPPPRPSSAGKTPANVHDLIPILA